MASRDRGLTFMERDGGNGVREGVRGQKNGLRSVRKWTPERVWVGARHRTLGFK